MNRNLYKFLFCVLFIISHSFCGQYLETFLENTGKGIVCGIGLCGASIMFDSYLQSNSEKSSEIFINWATRQLINSSRNQNEVKVFDFKLGSSWRNGTFYISVDKNDEKKINEKMLNNYFLSEEETLDQANIRYRLFREYKHIYNVDRLKLIGCSAVIETVVHSVKLPYYLLGKLTTALFFLFYNRYQEIEADRYAFKRMNLYNTKKDDVKKVVAYMEENAKKCEKIFKKKISSDTISAFFFNTLYSLYLKIFSNASESEKKRVRHKIAFFCFDSFYLSDWYTRAELGKKYDKASYN